MYFNVMLMYTIIIIIYNKQNLNGYLGSEVCDKRSTIRIIKTILATLDELLKTIHNFYNCTYFYNMHTTVFQELIFTISNE